MSSLTDKFVQRGVRTGSLAGAIGGGIIGGAALGLPKTYKRKGKTQKRNTVHRIARGVIGAAALGHAGRSIGGVAGGLYNTIKTPSWLNNARTKSEAQAAWKAHAKKTYESSNGSPKAFSRLRKEQDANKFFLKEAMLSAFADELEKIAVLGAALGGAAGYKLSPNTPKGKLMGTLIGAGAGHAIQGAGALAKRKLIDEPHAREERELYGYQPYAQASQAQNFY